MDLDLNGKHALVCGGSEGIGRAAALELALLGADVTLLARRADVLEAAAAALPRADHLGPRQLQQSVDQLRQPAQRRDHAPQGSLAAQFGVDRGVIDDVVAVG